MLKVQDGSIGEVIFQHITRPTLVSQIQHHDYIVIVQNNDRTIPPDDALDMWLTHDIDKALQDLKRYYKRYYQLDLESTSVKVVKVERSD